MWKPDARETFEEVMDTFREGDRNRLSWQVLAVYIRGSNEWLPSYLEKWSSRTMSSIVVWNVHRGLNFENLLAAHFALHSVDDWLIEQLLLLVLCISRLKNCEPWKTRWWYILDNMIWFQTSRYFSLGWCHEMVRYEEVLGWVHMINLWLKTHNWGMKSFDPMYFLGVHKWNAGKQITMLLLVSFYCS